VSDEDTKVASIFDKDIENFGKDLDKMIEHLNIVIATHNKQVEEIERLNNIINESNKMIEKIIEEVYKPVDKEWDNILCFIEDYKLKIKELKGSEKE
jgi:uridine kinase